MPVRWTWSLSEYNSQDTHSFSLHIAQSQWPNGSALWALQPAAGSPWMACHAWCVPCASPTWASWGQFWKESVVAFLRRTYRKDQLPLFSEFLLEVIHVKFSFSTNFFFKQNYPNGAPLIVVALSNNFAFCLLSFIFLYLNFISYNLWSISVIWNIYNCESDLIRVVS